jgi:hypothetical protein
MKRVEVRLNLDAVAPLLDVMKDAADELGPRLAADVRLPEADAELAEPWRGELLAGQNADVGTLLGLFGPDFFAEGVIALDAANAEAVLRASAALRLRLREAHLRGMEDESLEAGEVDVDELPEAQRLAFAAYIFLATLQEVVIQHLDPTAQD